jgi:outer membrane biosynthesis protein TonB
MTADEQGAMRGGLIGSVAFHVVVAVIAIGVFPFTSTELPPIPPAIPVDLVTIGEVNNVKQIDKVEDKPNEEQKPAEPEPEQQRQAALPPMPDVKPAPEPEPMPAPPPPPEAVPEPKPLPKPEEKKAEEKKPEAKPAQVVPPPKKEQAFDANKIAALLNKLPSKAKSDQPGEEKKLSTGPQKTTRVGEGTAMTATWQALLNAQFRACWNVQGGAVDAASQVVTVHVELNQDGSLASAPEIVNTAQVAAGGASYQVAAERALRAVRACNPLKNHPPENYSEWREMDFVFNPGAMLGG